MLTPISGPLYNFFLQFEVFRGNGCHTLRLTYWRI